jgi:hypothetical protein
MTMSEPPYPYWGNILKSNSNGTYFGLSLENVNRDERGFVDFEKMVGLDGIAIVNVVSNPQEAGVSGVKSLQSRITYNDGSCLMSFPVIRMTYFNTGSTWKSLTPPPQDSQGRKYDCDSTVRRSI